MKATQNKIIKRLAFKEDYKLSKCINYVFSQWNYHGNVREGQNWEANSTYTGKNVIKTQETSKPQTSEGGKIYTIQANNK